jgi:hypothetical protein
LSRLAQHPNVTLKGYPGEVDAPAILIGDREVVIALRDKLSYLLRRGILIRDEEIAGMFREWFDQVLWEDPSLVPLKELGPVGLLSGALERLKGAARGVEVVLDRNRDGAVYRRVREVIERLVEPKDEILALITYEGDESTSSDRATVGCRRVLSAGAGVLSPDPSGQSPPEDGVPAHHSLSAIPKGARPPDTFPITSWTIAREMLRLQSEPGLRDLISLHLGRVASGSCIVSW